MWYKTYTLSVILSQKDLLCLLQHRWSNFCFFLDKHGGHRVKILRNKVEKKWIFMTGFKGHVMSFILHLVVETDSSLTEIQGKNSHISVEIQLRIIQLYIRTLTYKNISWARLQTFLREPQLVYYPRKRVHKGKSNTCINIWFGNQWSF